MKIHNKLTDDVFILPLESNVNIIAGKDYIGEVIDCLNVKLNVKRKNKDVVILDENNEILTSDYNFIYQPYSSTNVNTNFEFKPKTTFNVELSEIIERNPELFQSIDQLRENCFELKTDQGMYLFEKILCLGTNKHIFIDINEFKISTVLSMFQIQSDTLTISEKYMMLYNLLVYLNRDKTNIIFLDFPIDDAVIHWINVIQSESNYFLLDNEQVVSNQLVALSSCHIIKLSNQDFKEEYDMDISKIQTISYLFHDYIMKNIDQQTEKNISILNTFKDDQTTFLIKFNDIKIQNIL